MLKKINESFDRITSNTKAEKSILESLNEFEEEEYVSTDIKEKPVKTIYIKYWADEERRDQGESDIYFDEFSSKDIAIDTAKRLVDRGEAASVEVLVSPTEEIETEEDEVIFGYDGVNTWSDSNGTPLEEKVEANKKLSFREFVKYLENIGNEYHSFSRVKNDKESGYRYILSNKLTKEQEDYLKGFENVRLGDAQLKYAPEIKYPTVIIIDRHNKSKDIKESFETEIDWDGGVQEITKNDYNYFLNVLPPAQPQHHTDGFTGEFLVGEPYTSDEQGRLLFSKFGKKDGKYYFLGTDYARRGTYEESLTEGSKTFLKDLEKDKDEMPKIFTHKNRFNYDIKQLRADPKSRKYSVGQFNIGDPRYKTHNGKEFDRTIDALKDRGYTEESLKEEIDYSDEKYLLKPYWYFTTHGVGVGSIPKSVKSIWGSFDADNGTYFATASVIPTKDLQEFEIIEKQPNIDDIPEKVRINIQNWLENPLNEARPRTRKEIRGLQGNNGYGWDDLIEYEIPSDVDEAIKTYKEIRADFKSYEENEPQYPHRTITRYEKITKEN